MSRAPAWAATLGTVSASPVARMMSDGWPLNTWLTIRNTPVPVKATSLLIVQRGPQCNGPSVPLVVKRLAGSG